MTKKILFWIEPPFIEFGIANIIQNEIDSELFAIIDTNKAKYFFEKQDIVNFQKTWYFRDCFSKSTLKPNLKYLSSIENKYDLNFWDILLADQTLSKFNKYYNFTDDQILSILEQECRFFENILDEINPDVLIIRLTDTSNSRLLHSLCNARKIRIQMLMIPRIGYKGMISNEQESFDDDILNETSNEKISNEKTFAEIQEYLIGYSKQQQTYVNTWRTSRFNWIKSGIEYFTDTLTSKHRGYWKNYGVTPMKVVKNEIINVIKTRLRSNFLKNNTQRKINTTQPFVYFPLQTEPERTLLMTGKFYSNQIEVISNIAKSLPINFKLFVKEHPTQKFLGWREINYYKKIKELPNVELYHPSISNLDMIKSSKLVITIAGSAGLESVCYQKPAIILADLIYSSIPSVFRLKNIDDLPDTIRKALKTKVSLADVNEFISKVHNKSFDYDESDLLMRITSTFFSDGFLFDRNISISAMKNFLKENNATFKILGNENIKKINKITMIQNKSKNNPMEKK
jgi:hypothetical protein